jgi:hypothetical protein
MVRAHSTRTNNVMIKKAPHWYVNFYVGEGPSFAGMVKSVYSHKSPTLTNKQLIVLKRTN